jgi:hypothetical protein
VAAEFVSFAGKVIIFWDDNIAGDREYARQLFRAITPYKKWWSSQASIHAGQDEEFLELAARSGCKQLFLGLESISQASVDGAHKRFNRVVDYERVIRRIHSPVSQAGWDCLWIDGDTRVRRRNVGFPETTGVQMPPSTS